MAKREYTVGVIGLGFGRSHIPAFQAHGCRVVAVCQRDRAHAQEIAGKYGIEGVFERWEDLLEKARPEIVAVATPPHLHKPIALAAFAQGAHVLCEKPIARTAAEGREILDAAAGALRYALPRDLPRWWRGQLHATTGPNGAFQLVPTKAVVPRTAGDGELPDVIGKATIAPLVKTFLGGIRAKTSPSPSLED